MKTYAGYWQRVKAFAFDYLVILGYLIALTLLFLIINRSPSATQWLFVSQIRAQATFILLLTLPVALYFAISESSTRQATWGKQHMGLMVTDKNGNRIRLWRAFVRALLKLIPWEIAHTLIWEIRFQSGIDPVLINYGFALVYVLIGLNIASIFMSRTRQSLYDLLSGTFVIEQRKHEIPLHQP